MKKKVYLSLPISGRPLEEAMAYARVMKEELQSQGYEVVTPFEVCPNSEEPYSRLMGRCIEVLLECDEVYFCLGWQRSKGCMTEFEIARIYGKEILIG
ncbi:DUF4406 domain-containing protein [Bacteroides pyogenes]|uniref:DUF4406 domain-containing protein n=1 Tax=Bacteroides pyogenes TaxID=310300 RepID=UPI001BA98CED|nr:DUF4406 domain-containing protein [Bacteroides pyogenes]MBR8707201.1 hypothetical protein [Bacteroides pyogenes]